MDTLSEIKSKYIALALTTVFHGALAALCIWVALNGSEKHTLSISSNDIPVIDLSGMEMNLEQVSTAEKSGSASDEKILTDPQERDVPLKYSSGSVSVKVVAQEAIVSNELNEALLKMHGLKGDKGLDKVGVIAGTIGSEKGSKISETKNGIELSGRKTLQQADRLTDASDEGIVVVEIIVDENGKVKKATPGQRGSTTTSANLYAKATQAAYQAKFSPSPEGIKEQRGTYTFVFTLE